MSEQHSYHHGNLRTELLRLGLEELESGGRESLSLRSLAERAGVSKTAPYRHFTDREAFLEALAIEGYRLLYEALRAAQPETAAGLLPSLGRAYLGFAQARPALYRLMTSPIPCAPDDPLPEAGEPYWPRRALLFLADCLAQDSPGAATASARIHAAAAAWAYIHGLVMIKIDGLFPLDFGEPDWDYLAGLSPRLDAAPGATPTVGRPAP